MPNYVDPIQDALLFLTFFENPVIVMTVLLLWMLYFVGIYWTRKTDRKDSTLVFICSKLRTKIVSLLFMMLKGFSPLYNGKASVM